jgi:hypothetical protein
MKSFDSGIRDSDAGSLRPNQGDTVLLPGSKTGFDRMISKVPVEIWYHILESVIAPLYVLDTTLESDKCHWWTRDRYHDRSIYARSEVEREKLRLVCRGWKAFADSNRWRWLRYNARSDAWDKDHLKDALAYALPVRNDTDIDNPSRNAIMPRRLTIHVDSNDSKELLYSTICHISSKLTILFVDCAKTYGPLVLDDILANSQAMPCMRCLMLTHIDFRGTPLQKISCAFPRLTGLTFLGGVVPHNDSDVLNLPQLESLYIGKVKLDGMRPETWRTPALLRLLIPINDNEGADNTFRFAKALGASLVLLRVDTNLEHFSVGEDLWTNCPRLTELVIRLSAAEFLAPVPAGHPLQYVVNKDSENARTKPSLRLRFQNNIIALGDSIKVIIMATLDWNRYLKDRQAGDTYLENVSRLLEVKGAQLQDMEGVTMKDYLAMPSYPLTHKAAALSFNG